MLNFMPCKVTEENFREVIDKYYIYIGFLEDGEDCIGGMASVLGFPNQHLGLDHTPPETIAHG